MTDSFATIIRSGNAGDLPMVDEIQRACPEAAHWNPGDYLDLDFRVALVEKRIVGFIVLRSVAPDERELLNLAVSPEFRRKGLGKALWKASLEGFCGWIFLEVRESNTAALEFYKLHDFQEVSRRTGYYRDPVETAIVMKFHSC
jgi:ribosomal-protein-alanine N-acetyltransferase